MLAKGPSHAPSMSPDPPLSRASPLPHSFSSDHGSCNQPLSLWERACSRRGHHMHPKCRLTHRFREQARSHIRSPVTAASAPNPGPLWERACSRRGHHMHPRCRLTHRFREQARSHIRSPVTTALAINPCPCGSELARDGVIRLTTHTASFPSRASLAPTEPAPVPVRWSPAAIPTTRRCCRRRRSRGTGSRPVLRCCPRRSGA